MPAGMPSHPNAIHVVILDSSGWTPDEDYGLEGWQETVAWITDAIKERWKSFYDADEWDGDSNHILLENDHAQISVAEDCGWTTMSLVPRGGCPELAEHWCHQIADNFQKLLDKMFPGTTYDRTSAWTCARRDVTV